MADKDTGRRKDPVETYEDILEHPETDRQPVAIALDQMVKTVGHVVMWANVLLIAAIVTQVTMRYLYDVSYPKLDEIQWHFYGLLTMVGISYALVTDSHVRVDILHAQVSRRARRVIEVIGILTLLSPFIYLMIDQGYDYFYNSFRVNESSDSPLGLPYRWALKAVIPISFVLLGIAALARLIHDGHAIVAGPASEREGKSVRLIIWALVGFAVVGTALTFTVDLTEEKLVIVMFITFVALLFTGYPVAWTLAGVGIAFCGLAYLFDYDYMSWTGLEPTLTGLDYLTLGAVVNRVYSTMSNPVLVALPMFIFMGLMLDQSGVAERLMQSMQRLFGKTRGGLAITVTVIGIILAASTGIIGASVVLLGVLSLPTMMDQKYSKPMATGVIAASGTLGILIPPSIMLVIMADQMALSVGDLFMAAVFPGADHRDPLPDLYLRHLGGEARGGPGARGRDESRLGGGQGRDARGAADAGADPRGAGLDLRRADHAHRGLGRGRARRNAARARVSQAHAAQGDRGLQVDLQHHRLHLRDLPRGDGVFLRAARTRRRPAHRGCDPRDRVRTHGHDRVHPVHRFPAGLRARLDRDHADRAAADAPDHQRARSRHPGLRRDRRAGAAVVRDHDGGDAADLVPDTARGFRALLPQGGVPPGVAMTDIYKGVVPFVLLQLTGLALVFLLPQLATWLPSVAY